MVNKKLKIAFVDYVLEPDKPGCTGLSDIVWDMACELVNQGHEAHIIASYGTDLYPDPRVVVHNFPTPPIGYRNILGHFWILKRAADIVRKIAPDIIHAPEYVSTAFMWSIGIRSPLVLNVPGNIYERIKNGNPYGLFTTQFLKIAARVSARTCSNIIVTSKEMEWWWAKTGAPLSRMNLIPYGVNTRLFRPIPDARNFLNIPPQKQIILYVGRLSHEKGLNYLLLAVQKVIENNSNVELHLLGEGPFKDDLIRSAQMLKIEDHIIFHGWIPKIELPAYYSAADITVLPSLSEGLPRTMIEALACGSPFLGTRITGIEDHIKDQRNGFLVEPRNEDKLANKIGWILHNHEQAVSVSYSGFVYVQENLTWKVVAQRINDEVYTKIIAK